MEEALAKPVARAPARPAASRPASPLAPIPFSPIIVEVRRLAVGVAGPVAVAATQFAAAMLLWGRVPAAAFGTFSFAMLLVQLSFGLSNALVGTPLAVAPRADRGRHRAACLAAHGIHLVAVALALPLLLTVAGAGSLWLFTLWALVANLRWAARAAAIADGDVAASARSDLLYAAAWCAAAAPLLARGVTLESVLWTLIAANGVALLVAGRSFLAAQVAALAPASLAHYARAIWPNQARWSIVGVLSTEASANAHAYIVTWAMGAALYAPLAFGSLFVRPLTIFLTALTQIDRPLFARHLAAGEAKGVASLVRRSLAGAAAAWLGNLVLALAAFAIFERTIAARGYDPRGVAVIVLLWFAILGLRAARTPIATAIQAAGAFRPLAACSILSGGVSVAAVALLVQAGPVWSLAGVLAGDAVLLALIVRLWRRCRP